jgi:hypothetical protein
MEVQYFDGAGKFRFRVHDDEPAAIALQAGPGTVQGDALAALVARLEAEVRRRRDELRAEPAQESYAMGDLDVLGERVRYPARDPDWSALARLNHIFVAARGTLESGLPLRAIARPELTPEQFRVAWALRDAGTPVPRRALPALVERALDQARDTTTDRGVATALQRERASWTDPETTGRLLAELEAAGLVRETAEGAVEPTEELRLLRI